MLKQVYVKREVINQIKEKRQKDKISQAVLATCLGVSVVSIQRFENKGEVSLILLERIAAFLDYKLDYGNLFEQKVFKNLNDVTGIK